MNIMSEEEKIQIISDFMLDEENLSKTLEMFMLALCKISNDTQAGTLTMSQEYTKLWKTWTLTYELT